MLTKVIVTTVTKINSVIKLMMIITITEIALTELHMTIVLIVLAVTKGR